MDAANRLHIRHAESRYLLPAGHPAPERVQARLDDIMERELADTLAQAFAPWFAPHDASLWLIRRLDIDLAVDAASERGPLARAWAKQIARAVAAAVQGGGDGDNVLWFESRAAYLAQFLADAAAGRAFGRWHYAAFDGLAALPVSAALRTAICAEPAVGKSALRHLPAAALASVLRGLSAADARQVLRQLAAADVGGNDAADALAAAWAVGPEGDLGEESRNALWRYLLADHGGGPVLQAAALALAHLDGQPRRAAVLAALARGDGAGLAAAGADASLLAPLSRWPGLAELGGDLAGWALGVSRHTLSGGVFLLLPLLDEWPLAKMAAGWPACAGVGASALLRLLLLAKCCGARLFHDGLIRELLGIDPALGLADVAAWQVELTPSHGQALHGVLLDWQRQRRAIGSAPPLLAQAGPLAVWIDGERGLWLAVDEVSPLTPPPLAKDTVFESLVAAEIIARLDTLPGDIAHLAAPKSWGWGAAFDRALSVAAQHLLRGFAWRLPGFAHANLPYLYANFLDFPAALEDEDARRVVRTGRPPLHLILGMTGAARGSYRLSWLDGRPFALFPEG